MRATEAADRLAKIAGSGDFFLAFPAIDALARIGDPRVVPQLLPLFAHRDLQRNGCRGARRAGRRDVVPSLAAMLNAGAGAGPIVRALSRLHARYEDRYRGGAYIADEFHATIGAPGAQALLDAVADAGVDDLRALVLVSELVEGPGGTERALTRLLGQSTIRTEVIEALVRQGAPVVPQLIEQLRRMPRLDWQPSSHSAAWRIGAPRTRWLGCSGEAGISRSPPPARSRSWEILRRSSRCWTLGDKDVAIRQAAIGALNSLGHPEMSQPVASCSMTTARTVRESAGQDCGVLRLPRLASKRCSHAVAIRSKGCGAPRSNSSRSSTTLERRRASERWRRTRRRARAAAAQGLAHLPGTEPVKALRSTPCATRIPGSAILRPEVSRCIGPWTVSGPRDVAGDDPAMHVRIAALEAIGAIDGDTAVDALLPYRTVISSSWRPPRCGALGSRSDERATRAPVWTARARFDPPLAAMEGLAARNSDEQREPPGLDRRRGRRTSRQRKSAIDALARIAKAGSQADVAVDALVGLTAEPARSQ